LKAKLVTSKSSITEVKDTNTEEAAYLVAYFMYLRLVKNVPLTEIVVSAET